MPSLTTSPWQAAIDRMSSKTIVGSRLRSAEWAGMPLALREGAMFSAGIQEVRILSAMRDKSVQALQQLRDGGTDKKPGLLQNRGRFVADMRSLLGAAPGDSGDLADITSRRRLELIFNFQQADAHGFASRKADLDPDVQDAFPAYRLVRLESRRMPRDWMVRWGEAGAKVGWVGASRITMVALVTSPIWAALSRFGRPWPPFDYASGMGLDAVDRQECEQLGLLPKGESPAARLQRIREATATHQRDWNENMQASVKGISQEGRAWLKSAFGDQVVIEGDRARWINASSSAIAPLPAPVPSPAAAPVVLPDVDRVATAAAKATSREEAHAVIALPAAERGSLTLNPTPAAKAQTEAAHDFLRSVLHRDVAPAASCKVELHAGRGYYDIDTATALVRNGQMRVTVHEIAHHIEISNPAILSRCKDFLRSRIKPGEKIQPLSKLYDTGSPSEFAYEDEWAARGGSPYTGRVYFGSIERAPATEILSMGLDRMYLDPVNFARQDPDYFKFILRVLRP